MAFAVLREIPVIVMKSLKKSLYYSLCFFEKNLGPRHEIAQKITVLYIAFAILSAI